MAKAAVDGKGVLQKDSDVHITFDDQQKINKFARYNARFEDLKDQLKAKKNDLRNLDNAADDLLLVDDSDMIPYAMGEVFVYRSVPQIQELLEQAKEKVLSEIASLEKQASELESVMSDMKTLLYAKFGNHINLEAEDE
ncbi:prefoldin subunit 4 [Bacillus rossius redtenbacheri]|uniref:prefoldin subunit 4 n=1 Tax=Bacillus rossius redtenbacheri TaxID=93214 RepID=UPI002FDCA728